MHIICDCKSLSGFKKIFFSTKYWRNHTYRTWGLLLFFFFFRIIHVLWTKALCSVTQYVSKENSLFQYTNANTCCIYVLRFFPHKLWLGKHNIVWDKIKCALESKKKKKNMCKFKMTFAIEVTRLSSAINMIEETSLTSL